MAPQRQIRATWDEETITVYQAFNASIAEAAVTEQHLAASPRFKAGRFTWIKPSWCWMMYRCGYSFKDPGQERVLALRVKHEHFREMLDAAILAHDSADTEAIKVQWDPERDFKLERLPYRSIQIGLPGQFSRKWADEWICSIADVTHKARGLREAIERSPSISAEELRAQGLLPDERPYDEMLSQETKEKLRMLE